MSGGTARHSALAPPSLQDYVLVSREARVEIFRRTPSATWEYIEVREGNVRLASGPALDLAVLYADLPRNLRKTTRRATSNVAQLRGIAWGIRI